jgi:hypothetical protein
MTEAVGTFDWVNRILLIMERKQARLAYAIDSAGEEICIRVRLPERIAQEVTEPPRLSRRLIGVSHAAMARLGGGE